MSMMTATATRINAAAIAAIKTILVPPEDLPDGAWVDAADDVSAGTSDEATDEDSIGISDEDSAGASEDTVEDASGVDSVGVTEETSEDAAGVLALDATGGSEEVAGGAEVTEVTGSLTTRTGISTAAFRYPQVLHSSCLRPLAVEVAALSTTHLKSCAARVFSIVAQQP